MMNSYSPSSQGSQPKLSPTNSNTADSPLGRDPGSTSFASPGHGHSATSAAEKRVALACHRCRAKRARCSGDRPVCKACEKASEDCTWPEGRKRKRTRREMEEDERRERESLNASGSHNTTSMQSPISPQGVSLNGHHNPLQQGSESQPAWFQQFPAAPGPSLNHVWPPAPAQSNSTHQSQNLKQAGDQNLQKTDEQLARVMDAQYAFIEGDPSRQEDLELFYYRFSGSTAIRPGINRISLKLQPRLSNRSTAPAPVPITHEGSLPSTPVYPQIIFDEAGMPPSHIYIPLFDTFFRTLGRHFPSISKKRMEERLETGTMSAFMLNCICALAARFHTPITPSPTKDCAPFITKAQELIIPLLHLPTTDSVTGLLLLAWANYGQSSESGLWQYSGMAMRMALDLGLHEVSDIYESSAHVVRTRLLFWSLFITDRILSFSTGRPVSISEEIIEIPLPTDEDLTPDPARTNEPTAFQEPVQPNAFSYLVRLMVLCGRIANVLNGRRGKARTLVGPTPMVNTNLLGELQNQLVQFYADLPDGMKWSVEVFQLQESRGHGGVFLTLHLWANAVLALVYHPELLMHPSGMETPMSSSMDRSLKLSIASSRLISECLVFADLMSSQSYLASPMVVQPVYVASLAFIYDMKLNVLPSYHPSQLSADDPSGPRTADFLLTSISRQSLSVLTRAMQRMEHYWAGISYVSSILEQKITDLVQFIPELSQLSNPSHNKKTFISLPDKGLLRRFSGKDLPHNTAPPTETSLRASVAEENKARTYALDELLNSYSVQGMFIQPADSMDLETLLNSYPMGMQTDGQGRHSGS